MEESWRFRPIQGNICPTCSTSHFPFCSHPLPFDRNGFGGTLHHRLPNDPSFQRPFFDPFHDNRVMPRSSSHYDDRTNLMTPIYGNPKDVYWNRNHNLDRDPIRKFPEPPMMGDSAVFNGFHRNGFNSDYDYGSNRRGEFFESDRIHKRMKVDEMNSGSFAQIPASVCGDSNSNPKRMSLEDERRLSLIREHGRNPSVHPGGFTGGENPPTGYFHQQQVQNKTNGFRPDVDHALFHNNSQNEQSQPSHLDQTDDTLNPSIERYGSSNVQTGAPNFVDSTRRSQDLSVVPEEKGFQHMNQRELYFSNSQKGDLSPQPNISHRSSYPVSQASHGEYRAHDYQQLQLKDFDPAKEPRHPNLTNWQVSPASYIPNHDHHYQGQQSDVGQSFEVKPSQLESVQRHHNLLVVDQFGSPNINKQGNYLPVATSNCIAATRQEQTLASWAFGIYPPLPPVPPPPFPVDPSGPSPSHLQASSSPQKTSSSMYPIPVGTSVTPPLLHSSAHEAQSFHLKHQSPDKPKRINASLLLRQPHRATRPDHIVIILRGLPGSGKSYLAKMLRDLEVENGGDAPRIHSMDDYFMTEVEKVEEREGSKSSGSVKGRKKITKKVMEYCYEPEMEEAYRSSMLKAFKKTLEEGSFAFIIVDDRNLRVADFAQFWATAKRSGYEVYLLEATYKDPVGCAARNVHGFISDDIQEMAERWEEAPYLYLQLDAQSLFHGDALDEGGIQEVDMDMEDVACDEDSSALNENSLKTSEPPPIEDYALDGSFKDEERWDTEGNDPTGVKELGRSKWSHDDDEDIERPKGAKGNANSLSGLIQAYSKGDKSVHWGDQVGKTGFSIGVAKKANMMSLVIGPGAGYNLKSNPLLEEEKVGVAQTSWESSRRTVFQEHLRAERESFRAVFDRRRRIGGLDAEDE